MRIVILFMLLLAGISVSAQVENEKAPYVLVLGVAQDAGYPHIGCEADCCSRVFKNPDLGRMVVSLAIIDPISEEQWIIDATPDFPKQLKMLNEHSGSAAGIPDGIFLTHAHIGHYTGLMYLGREALGAKGVQVFAMPKMKAFLEGNGPWGQLVALNNIELRELENKRAVKLNERLVITPVQVPHRDEYSETVGYVIEANANKLLFVPDINKWETWDEDLAAIVKNVDFAFLDASFYKDGEIKGRPMSEIPHPFVEETMSKLESLDASEKEKVYFIHFNHTNPLLDESSKAVKEVQTLGFNIARQGMIIRL